MSWKIVWLIFFFHFLKWRTDNIMVLINRRTKRASCSRNFSLEMLFSCHANSCPSSVTFEEDHWYNERNMSSSTPDSDRFFDFVVLYSRLLANRLIYRPCINQKEWILAGRSLLWDLTTDSTHFDANSVLTQLMIFRLPSPSITAQTRWIWMAFIIDWQSCYDNQYHDQKETLISLTSTFFLKASMLWKNDLCKSDIDTRLHGNTLEKQETNWHHSNKDASHLINIK